MFEIHTKGILEYTFKNNMLKENYIQNHYPGCK